MLDVLRQNNPKLGFALYAMEPGGVVTLEIHTPEKDVYTFTGATEAEAVALAFPPPTQPAQVQPGYETPDPPKPSVFD